jgi:beta-lactam-binding protein with PASTA domain
MTGWRAIGAQAELTRAGIKTAPLNLVEMYIPNVGSGAAPPSTPILPGTVLAQSPPAGSRIDQDTMVTLTVAK